MDQSFNEWVKDHYFTILANLITVGGLIWRASAWKAKLEDKYDDIVAYYKRDVMGIHKILDQIDTGRKEIQQKLEELSECLDEHDKDISRHIDPIRDERRWGELTRWMVRMEDKVDQIKQRR